jgi:hypothetical protein
MPLTKSGVIRFLNKEAIEGRDFKGKGGGKEYPLSALPEATRIHFALQAGKTEFESQMEALKPKPSAEIAALVEADHAAMDAKTKFVPTVDWDHFRRKTAKVQGEAYKKAEVVNQLKKLVDLDAVAVFNGAKKTPINIMIQKVAEANPAVCQSWRTLQNWWFGKPGKPGCVKFDPKDYAAALAGSYAGRVKLAACSAGAFEYYAQHYLHRSRPSHADTYRRTCEMGAENGWEIPSAITLKRRLENEYSVGVITLMREGDEALRQLIPFQSRDKTVFKAGEAVSGDGLKFDRLWTKWPDGEIINTSTAWFWQDIYSGKIIAWRLGKTESTDLFRLATFDLTGNFLPTYMQVDNTRVAANKMMTAGAEGRHRFGNQPTDAMGMLLMLGIDVRFTDPNHAISSPGSKPVERAFGIGGIHEKVATNQRIRDRGFSKATAISSDELRETIAYEVRRHNSQEKRRSQVCGGVNSFDTAFAESYKTWSPRKAAESQRRLLMLAFESVKANSKNGMVTIQAGKSQFGGNKYWAEGLNEYRGQHVAVFYDPDDLTKEVDVYSLDGKFLMTAAHEAGVGFTDKEAGGEYKKRTQRLVKLEKLKAGEVKAIQKLHNDKLPLQSEPEKPESKVVSALFKKPLEEAKEFDADAAFSAAIRKLAG